MKNLAVSSLVAASLMLIALPVSAQKAGEEQIYNQIEAVHGNAGDFLRVADRLGKAMARSDFATVAALAAYPLTVEANGETYDLLEARDLVTHFESLVSEEVRKEVARFSLADLVVTGEGVGFAGGGLWMSNICLDNACRRTRWAITRIDDLNPAYPDRENERAARAAPSAGSAEFPMAAGSWGGKVRSGPGMHHAQIGSLQNGDRITLLERTSIVWNGAPWFRIEMPDGRTGYHWGGIICGLERPIPGAFEICDR